MDPNYPMPNAPPPAGVNPNVMPGYPDQPYPPPAGYPQPEVGPPPPPSGMYPPVNGPPQYPTPGAYPPGYPPTGAPPPQVYPPTGAPPQGYPPTGMQPQGYPSDGYPPSQGYPPEGYPPPIAMQPVATPGGYPPPGVDPSENWMQRPAGLVCPPGLEYLTMIDQLLVHQKVEMLEAFLGFETKNKYSIKNNLGQKIYTAKEDSDCCTRSCLGPARPFDMKIKDNMGNEVIHLYRPCRCDSCLFPCCLQEMEVMSPPGTLIGSVVQEWSIFAPKFRVKGAAGETVLRIQGPFCTYSICGDVEFDILSKDGNVEVGKITKQWSGLLREAFTDSDHFGISFPIDLDVNMKAVMLGACFLIDFLFFEKQNNKEQDGIGML